MQNFMPGSSRRTVCRLKKQRLLLYYVQLLSGAEIKASYKDLCFKVFILINQTLFFVNRYNKLLTRLSSPLSERGERKQEQFMFERSLGGRMSC